MRILLIIDSLSVGGAEDVATNLSVSLKKNKQKVALLVLSKKIETPNYKKLCVASVEIFFMTKRKYSCASLREARNIIKKFNPDIINSSLSGYYYSFLLRKASKAKIVHTIQNTYRYDSTWKGRFFHRLFLPYAQAIVAVSQNVAKTIPMYNKNIITIPNCTEIFSIDKTKKFDLKKIIKKSSDSIIFINVANLRAEKNHLLLIKSFARLKDHIPRAKLLLAGDGVMRKKIEKTIQELELKNDVVLLGRRNDIRELLKACDIFVLTSISEGLPLAMLEAMMAKLPVISTRAGGTEEIIKNGINGYLVNSDEKLISKYMLKLASDLKLRKKLGNTGRLMVEKKYSLDTMTKNYINLYNKLLKNENSTF